MAPPPGPPPGAAAEAILPGVAARQQALEAAGWMVRGQSTFVQQFHPAFRAPYRGDNSLGAGDQGRNTLSLDVILGRRLWEGAEAIIDPQVSGWPAISAACRQAIAAFSRPAASASSPATGGCATGPSWRRRPITAGVRRRGPM
nr:hypothetical protein [Dankookia rubra]